MERRRFAALGAAFLATWGASASAKKKEYDRKQIRARLEDFFSTTAELRAFKCSNGGCLTQTWGDSEGCPDCATGVDVHGIDAYIDNIMLKF